MSVRIYILSKGMYMDRVITFIVLENDFGTQKNIYVKGMKVHNYVYK